jgi:hypothetical protein
MPEAKSGKAGSPVSPADPVAAEEADQADPGEVEKIKAEQRKTQTGKYGAVKVKPNKPPETKEEKEKKQSWIAIKMVDEANKPVTGIAYRVTLPDGETVAEGTLDDKGAARIEGIEPGSCKVTFPTLDKDAWKKA